MADNNSLNIYEKEAEEMTAMRKITKQNKFERTDGGFVNLTFDGVLYERVKVVRLFPFTDANKYISIRQNDDKAKEIGIIEDLSELDDDTKEKWKRI